MRPIRQQAPAVMLSHLDLTDIALGDSRDIALDPDRLAQARSRTWPICRATKLPCSGRTMRKAMSASRSSKLLTELLTTNSTVT